MAAQHNYLDNIVQQKGKLWYLCKSVMAAQHNYQVNIVLCKGEHW